MVTVQCMLIRPSCFVQSVSQTHTRSLSQSPGCRRTFINYKTLRCVTRFAGCQIDADNCRAVERMATSLMPAMFFPRCRRMRLNQALKGLFAVVVLVMLLLYIT